jgi:methyl-CpG-binding domain protein 4
MNWIPPKSPFNLIQEHVYHDPWKIFVVCIFCNLTKRVDAEPYMWKFFKKYPTPKDAARADPKEIEEMIKPLGLSQRRSVTLVKMSNDYLLKDWKNKPDVLYGIGKYASDAYRIFCLGDWAKVSPKDGALVNYHNFLKTSYNLHVQS